MATRKESQGLPLDFEERTLVISLIALACALLALVLIFMFTFVLHHTDKDVRPQQIVQILSANNAQMGVTTDPASGKFIGFDQNGPLAKYVETTSKRNACINAAYLSVNNGITNVPLQTLLDFCATIK